MTTSAPNVVFEPIGVHKTTMIVLHGRGSTAQRFAEPFLSSLWYTFTHPHNVPKNEDPCIKEKDEAPFRTYFTNTRFVFPTAPLRRAVAFNRSLTHQWFDSWSHVDPQLKEHLQAPGLRETSAHMRDLLRAEIETVGAKNVVVVGLSQGCAASLVSGMLWEGEPFAGVVGMCGYLPFVKSMHDVVNEEDIEDDLFEREVTPMKRDPKNDGDGSRNEKRFDEAVTWLREELGFKESCGGSLTQSLRYIPVFLGHGMHDETVPYKNGKDALEFLRSIGVDVQWKGYADLGHWYSEDVLRDIAVFLRKLDGWEDFGNNNVTDSDTLTHNNQDHGGFATKPDVVERFEEHEKEPTTGPRE